MIKKPNQFDIYILLWCLYRLKGVLYPIGVINGLVHYAMLIWGLLIVIRYFVSYRKQQAFIKMTLVLLLMYIVYGVLNIYFGPNRYFLNGNQIRKTTYLLASIDSLFPIFVFHHFAKKGCFDAKKIPSIVLVLILVSFIDILASYRDMSSGLLDASVTNNKTYGFLALFPLLFFVDNVRKRYIYAAFIMVVILLGVKRGAILIGMLSVLFFVYQDFRHGSRKNRILVFILGMFFIVGVGVLFWYMVNKNSYFSMRLEATLEGDSSGRERIRDDIWYGAVKTANYEELAVGRGADATIEYAGNYAHNDWLETICNNGLLGIVLLALFFIHSLLLALKFRYYDKIFFLAGTLLFFIALAKSLFSMSIQNLHIAQCMLWGLLSYQAQHLQQSNNLQTEQD